MTVLEQDTPQRRDRAKPPRRVGLIGWGAIGRVVGQALAQREVTGAELVCVVDNRPRGETLPVPQLSFDEAIGACDLFVEAAGQTVVRDWGERLLQAGCDLLVVSTGALTDRDLTRRLRAAGPGRVHFTAGAVGGLDLLQAVTALGPLDRVELTTTKLPSTLRQPWMDAELLASLESAAEPVELMRGTALDVPAKFPKSTNVAATVAVAVGDPEQVQVRVVADPAAVRTRHVLQASGPAGSYRFEMEHEPDSENPATSRVVPYAVLRSLDALAGGGGRVL